MVVPPSPAAYDGHRNIHPQQSKTMGQIADLKEFQSRGRRHTEYGAADLSVPGREN
jgi:hypothetical protein